MHANNASLEGMKRQDSARAFFIEANVGTRRSRSSLQWADGADAKNRRHQEPPKPKEISMPNYMLLLHSGLNRPRPSSPDDFATIMKAYMDWTDKIRSEGRHKGGQKLTDDAGRIMQLQGGRVSITDGPYAEAKEIVGGFYVISAKDYKEACEVAEGSPHLKYGGRIEVRQVDEM
jgi:hypothetical protein